MAVDGITGSGSTVAIRAADASVRSGGVASALATPSRFNLPDAFLVAGRPGSQRSRSAGERSADDTAGSPSVARDGTDGGPAFSRSVSAFVAQSIAQEQDLSATGTVQASLVAAGLRAYARGGGAATRNADLDVEIIPPYLSSGHALDLTV